MILKWQVLNNYLLDAICLITISPCFIFNNDNTCEQSGRIPENLLWPGGAWHLSVENQATEANRTPDI